MAYCQLKFSNTELFRYWQGSRCINMTKLIKGGGSEGKVIDTIQVWYISPLPKM